MIRYRTSIAIVWCVALIVGAHEGTALTIPTNTWTHLSTTATTRRIARAFVNCTEDRTLTHPVARGSYSSPVKDAAGGLIYFGGGHSGHPANDIETFDAAALQWTQRTLPECLPSCCTTTPTCGTCTAGTNIGGSCGPSFTNPPGVVDTDDCGVGGMCSRTTPNGFVCSQIRGGAGTAYLTATERPYTEHTYQRFAWDAPRSRWLGVTTGTDIGTDASGSGALWSWNPTTFAATLLTTTVPLIPGSDIAQRHLFYSPDIQTVFWVVANRIWELSPATNVWTERAAGPASLGTGERYTAYDSVRHRHLFAQTHSRTWYSYYPLTNTWELTATVPDTLKVPTTNPAVFYAPTSVDYDPINDVYLLISVPVAAPSCGNCVGGPNVLWEYNPTTGIFREVAPSGTPPNGYGRGQHLFYLATEQAFFLVNIVRLTGEENGTGGDREGDIQMWALKYAPADITPLPTSTPVATSTAAATATETHTPAPTPTHTTGATATFTATWTPQATATPVPTSAEATPTPGALVTLTVQELLPVNAAASGTEAGRTRVAQPVTSGIPLQDADAVVSTSVLAVKDGGGSVVPAQFRVLKSYPSGNAQWVLVDIQADVTADSTATYTLVRGTNTASGTLATDNGTTITVNTTAASFTITKANWNFIDAMTLGGSPLVTTGHTGGVVYVAADATTYRSSNDASSTAVIEENGALRTVIRARGRLKSAGGATALGYTARMHFYAGSAQVKVQLELENAFDDDVTRKIAKSLSLELPTALSGAKTFTLGTQTSTATGTIATAGTARLHHSETDNKATPEGVTDGAVSYFNDENDWGAKFTRADLDVDAPAYDGNGRSLYSTSLCGTTFKVTVDGHAERTISFAGDCSDFTRAVDVDIRDLVSVLNTKLRAAAGGTDEVTATWDGYIGSHSGVLRLRSLGTDGRTSVMIGDGTANAYLGYTPGMRADGDAGYLITNGATTVHDFGGRSEFARGFGAVVDAGNKGVAVAMRDFDAFAPTALRFTDAGVVAVDVLSDASAKGALTFDWGVHDTRDIVMDFSTDGTAGSRATDVYYQTQYPLMLRAPYAQYATTAAILGRTQLVDEATMTAYHAANAVGGVNQFSAANLGTFGVSSYTMPNEQITRTRTYNWRGGGRQSNNDYSIPKLLAWLQTGRGGLYQTAYNFIRFTADQAIHHSDRDDRTNPAVWGTGVEAGVTGGNLESVMNGNCPLWNSKWEESLDHANVLGLPVLYYLTGDESLRDALLDHGEWMVREHPFTSTCAPGARSVWQRTKWHAILWEMFDDVRFKAELDKLVDNTLCASLAEAVPPVWGTDGFDHNRGWEYHHNESNGTYRSVGSGVNLTVWSEANIEAWRVLPDTDPRKEQLADRLVGLAYGMINDVWFDRADDCPALGAPSFPEINSTNPGDSYYVDYAPGAESTRLRANMADATALLAFAYERTRDPGFLVIGRRIVGAMAGMPTCGAIESVRQLYSCYNGFGAQSFIWLDLNDTRSGVFLNDNPPDFGWLGVTDLGAGSYQLSWIVPSNATGYQIKYGPQPIVPNLGFDKYGRTYTYDPATYDNFWAINGATVTDQPVNITTEPTPAASGTEQSYVLSGLDPGTAWHFALRADSDSGETPTPAPTRTVTPTPAPPTPTPTPRPTCSFFSCQYGPLAEAECTPGS